MISLLFTTDPKITDILKKSLELEKVDSEDLGDFEIYKKKGHILCQTGKGEKSFRQAFLYAYSEYNPDIITYVGTGYGVGTEIREGDIILPNVFFYLDPEIRNAEINAENRDKFLANPLFLEQYTLQNDYDFEDFGLCVGGINITANVDTSKDPDMIEKIRIAYEADIIDDYSYWFVEEAKNLDVLDKSYVVLGSLAENEDISMNHIAHIVSFLLENLDATDMVGSEEDQIDSDSDYED